MIQPREGGRRPLRRVTLPLLFLAVLAAGIAIGRSGQFDLIVVGLGRLRDRGIIKWGPRTLRVEHQQVAEVANAQAAEMEQYLLHARDPAGVRPIPYDFSSPAAYQASLDPRRKLLGAALAYPPPGSRPPGAIATTTPLGSDEWADYFRLTVPVRPGLQVTGLLLLPRQRSADSARLPLIIAAHGRGGPPAADPDGQVALVQPINRDLAWGALRRGYAVWEPTFVFYADQKPENLRERLETFAREAGTSVPSLEIAKVRAGLDALLERPDIDPDRVAMIGISYGGFYALYTAALEPRIRAIVVAAYFNDRAAILDANEPRLFLDWRFLGSLRLFRDPEVVAMICPRPIQIQCGTSDQLFPIEGARRAAPLARMPYEKLGVPERFEFIDQIARHDFDGEKAWDFLEEVFRH